MKAHCSGFTLIEFLVSLALGLLLLSILMTVYVSVYKTYRLLTGWLETQESAQIALASLRLDAYRTGFIGCVQLKELSLKDEADLQSLVPKGWLANSSHDELPISARLLHKDSDIIQFSFAEVSSVPVKMATGSLIRFQGRHTFQPHEELLISDCQHAEKFRLSNLRFRNEYHEDASVRRLHKVIYYVAATQRKNQSRKTIYALYRRDLSQSQKRSVEWVEGVERLKIYWGVANHLNEIREVAVDTVLDWKQLRRLKMVLHFSSIENVLAKGIQRAATSRLPNRGSDRRLQRVWAQTVMFRAMAREGRY